MEEVVFSVSLTQNVIYDKIHRVFQKQLSAPVIVHNPSTVEEEARQRHLCEFKTNLIHKASSRAARDTKVAW